MLSEHPGSLPWPLRSQAALLTAPAPVRLVALGGGTMVFATDTAVHVHDGVPGAPAREVWRLDWEPGALSLSPSGRFVLLVAPRGNRADIIAVDTGERVLTIGALDGRPRSVTAAFSVVDSDELLVLSRQEFVLEALTLPVGQRRFYAEFTSVLAFVFDSLHPMLDGDTLVAIGHGQSESKDSLVTLSLRTLLGDPVAAAREVGRQARVTDYAYRLAVGPCGRDGMVVFRDPEQDEEPDEDAPPAVSDIENFRGLYIRRLGDGGLVERIAYDSPIESGAPLYATHSVVVVGEPGRVALIPRAAAGDGPPAGLDAPAYAFDPLTRRIAVVRNGRTIEVHQLRDGEKENDHGWRP